MLERLDASGGGSQAGEQAGGLGPAELEALALEELVERVSGARPAGPQGPGLARLARSDPALLASRLGLGPASAARLAAAFALGRRVERARADRGRPLSTPARVHRLMAPEIRGLERETFHVLLLDTKHRLLGRRCVSVGTLTASLVHPREVFRPALLQPAAAVIAVHNHPSGDPEPSAEDLAVTRRLIEAGDLLGVPLLDHVIVGEGYVSLRERMDFKAG